MDENEMASFFAAKNENIELKKKILELETQISKSMSPIKISRLQDENSKMAFFISTLGRFPFFWARTYKNHIEKFIVDNGLWDGE